MKKTILKTLGAVLVIGIAMSSCLGDNNTKLENTGYAYIKQGKVGNMALATGNIAFTSDYVNKLDVGECYNLSYAINGKDGANADGVSIAHRVDPVGDGDPVAKGTFYSRERPQEKVDYYLSQLNVALWSGFDEQGLDDRWVISYETKAYAEDLKKDAYTKKDNLRLYATILPEDQKVKPNNDPIGKNKVIVRVYIEREQSEGTIDTSKGKVFHKGTANIDMRELRYYLLNNSTVDKDGSLAAIQFKYINNTAKDNETPKLDEKALGTLDLERPTYYMVLKQ